LWSSMPVQKKELSHCSGEYLHQSIHSKSIYRSLKWRDLVQTLD
jgi:hypothetical protein